MGDRLKQKRALITGGGTGIGRGIAEAFVAEDTQVVICGRRHGPLAQSVEALRKVTPHAHFIECDITDPADVEALAKQTTKLLGGLDVLVNNAGIFEYGTAATTDLKIWDRVFSINVRGAFLVTQACLPMFEGKRGCSVINISAAFGRVAEQDTLAYSCSKAALEMFTRCCAVDFGDKGIRFNTISPSVIDTPMQDRSKAELGIHEWRSQMAFLHPLTNVGTPRDVALAAVYLASDEAPFITGVNFPVDGGLTAK